MLANNPIGPPIKRKAPPATRATPPNLPKTPPAFLTVPDNLVVPSPVFSAVFPNPFRKPPDFLADPPTAEIPRLSTLVFVLDLPFHLVIFAYPLVGIPTVLKVVPNTKDNGPITAAKPSVVIIVFCVPLSSSPNLRTNVVPFSIMSVKGGIKCSDAAIPIPSNAERNSRIEPFALSDILSAILVAAPSEFSRSLVNSFNPSEPSDNKAIKPGPAS